MKSGSWFLDHLVWARGPGTKSLGTIVYRVATFALPIVLLRPSWSWMAYLGHWTGSRGLPRPIQTDETRQAHLGTPDHGPRVSDRGPLVLAL